MASRTVKAKPSEGAAHNGESGRESQHYYRFRESPKNLATLLLAFRTLGGALRRRYVKAWCVLCAIALSWAGIFTFVSSRVPLPPLVVLVVFSALLFCFVFVGWKIFSSRRTVNPSPSANFNGCGFVFFLGLVSLIFFAGVSDALPPGPLLGLNTLPRMLEDPFSWLLVGALVTGSVLVPAQLFATLRFRQVIPDSHEELFIQKVVEPLLSETPSDQHCTLVINPFPKVWSEEVLKPAKFSKEVTFDYLLKLNLPLGCERRLTVQLVHRTSQKGQRKFKGYKHKVKLSIRLTDPRLPGQRPQTLLNKLKKPELPGTAAGKFRRVLATEHCQGTSGEWEYSEVYETIKSISPELTARDVLHPEIVLDRVRWLTAMAAEAIDTKA